MCTHCGSFFYDDNESCRVILLSGCFVECMQKKSEGLLGDEEKEEEAGGARIFFKLLEKVGVFGKYQVLTIVLWCFVMYLNGGLMFMTPFLFYEEPYVCPQEPIAAACKDFVCGLPEDQRIDYLPKEEMIHSLANHFGDYRCPTEKLGFDSLVAFMFFGAAVGFLCLTFFGEMVGRKLLMQINVASYVVGLTLTIFCVDVYMAAAGLFLAALGINNAYIICFYFIIEVCADDNREKFSVVCQAFYGVGVILDILWYWWIADWQVILGACFLGPAVVVLIVLSIFVKDTPSCLVLRNDSAVALKKFQQIAKMNGVVCGIVEEEIIDAKEHFDFSIEKANMKKFTVVDLFKYKSTRFITILLSVVFCIICISFYAPSLMLSEFDFDLFINGLAIGVSQLVAYTGTFFIVERARRKLLANVCFAVTFACAFTLIFVWDQGSDEETSTAEQAIIMVLIFLFQLAISVEFTVFYVYENELYPTQARVIGTSIVSLIGEGVVIFAETFLDLCFEHDIPVMIIFAALAGLCIGINFQLPQTFQKVPEELIQEFREKSSQYKSKISSSRAQLTSALSRNALSSA